MKIIYLDSKEVREILSGKKQFIGTKQHLFPGDVVWVREPWRNAGTKDSPRYEYKTDNEGFGQWESPVRMPKRAGRLFLRILPKYESEASQNNITYAEGTSPASVICIARYERMFRSELE